MVKGEGRHLMPKVAIAGMGAPGSISSRARSWMDLMSSAAAAARFAARYDLFDLIQVPPDEADCPTRPTENEACGTPSEPSKTADSCGFSNDCPTSPTCPTHFEGVGDENGSSGEAPTELAAWLQEGRSTPLAPGNGGEPPAMTPEEWAGLTGEAAVDGWGLTVEERAEGLAGLKNDGRGRSATTIRRDWVFLRRA